MGKVNMNLRTLWNLKVIETVSKAKERVRNRQGQNEFKRQFYFLEKIVDVEVKLKGSPGSRLSTARKGVNMGKVQMNLKVLFFRGENCGCWGQGPG